jgi:hypothetical protein
MNDSEGIPASDECETRDDDVSDAAHAGHKDAVPFEKVEWMAGRAREALQQLLPDDKQVRAELRQVVSTLTSLQAHMVEWKECHHLLHEVLSAFSPFHAHLTSLREDGLSTAGRQVLLQNWRLCQERLDVLVDFTEGIVHIGNPLQRENRGLRGEPWAIEIVALQQLLEDTLKEDIPSPENLLDLADAFNSACHRHLALADRNLRTVMDKSQRLIACLLGDIP